jgi:hypothetical protein
MDAPQLLTADDLKPVVGGYRASAAVIAMTSLGIPPALAKGPRTADELADELVVDRRALGRVLRFLAAVGALTEDDAGCFGTTGFCDALTDPAMRDMLLGWAGLPQVFAAWSRVGEGVRVGRSPFEVLHGTSFHRYLGTDADAAAAYNAAMSSTVDGFQLMADAVELGPDDTVAAIGGGVGVELVPFLRDHPGRRGILMDLPVALVGAEETLAAHGLLDRVEIVSGDARAGVPAADAYALSTVLRCLPDDDAVAVLTSCRKGLIPGGQVHVFDPVVPDGRAVLGPATMDLTAWVVYGAADRTLAEWHDLHGRAGLQVRAVNPRDEVFSVLSSAPG